MTDGTEYEPIPDGIEERLKLLEAILIAAATSGRAPADNRTYAELRSAFMQDATLKLLLPGFVRTCRDLDHFWPYIKGVDPQWAPRRKHIRDELTPLFDYVEGVHKAPVDVVASDV